MKLLSIHIAIFLTIFLTKQVMAGGFLGDLGRGIGDALGGDIGGAITHVSDEGDKETKKLNETVINPTVDAVKDGTEATYRATVLPLKATSEAGQAALGMKSWSEADEEVSSSWTTTFDKTGDAVSNAGQASYGANEALVKVPVNVSREVAGKDAEQIVENIMVPTRLTNAAALSATEYASLVVKGQDPKMLIAVPIATAMRAAREHHYPRSKPLPDLVKLFMTTQLSGFFHFI